MPERINVGRLILLAVYDKDGEINENTIEYAKELNKHGRLVVICSCEKINPSFIKQLMNEGIEYDFVSNWGYDFGMYYKRLIGNPDRTKYKRLLLCNDSVLITKPLDEVFKWLDRTTEEYIGIQDGYISDKELKKLNKIYNQHYMDGWHIESRFIQLRGKAMGLVDKLLFDGVFIKKEDTIAEYEIGWSKRAELNCTTNFLYNIDEYPHKEGISQCYDTPVENMKKGSPFVKKDFRNYGNKKQFKPVIDYLCALIFNKKMNATTTKKKTKNRSI